VSIGSSFFFFLQIKYVVEHFGPTFLNSFKTIVAELKSIAANPAAATPQSISSLVVAALLATKVSILLLPALLFS
jgi:hypothetical protein